MSWNKGCDKVILLAGDMGHHIDPGARKTVKFYCDKAEQGGLISDNRDYATCVSALISAGIEKATQNSSVIVTEDLIKEGWETKLSIYAGGVGGAACPPWKCVRRSVLDRVDSLKITMPTFKDLLGAIEE
jgi:hypothetical protein